MRCSDVATSVLVSVVIVHSPVVGLSIQPVVGACPAYSEIFIRGSVIARLVLAGALCSDPVFFFQSRHRGWVADRR